MAAGQVIQVLQALDVKSLGMSAGEKKGELRAQVGLPRDIEAATASAASAAAAPGGTKVEEAKGGAKTAAPPAQRTLPKIAPGSTAEKMGKSGTEAAKGVSKPTGGKGVEEKKS